MLNFKGDTLPNVKRDTIIEAVLKGSKDKEGNLYWGFNNIVGKNVDNDILNGQKFYHVDVGYWHNTTQRVARSIIREPCFKWRISTNLFFNNQLVDISYDRLTKKLPEKWKKDGRYIVVCPSSKHISGVLKLENWEKFIIRDIKSKTDRPILVHNKGEKKLSYLLNDAYCVVTSYSRAALDAIFHGIPIISNSNSFAAPVSNFHYENLEYYDMDFIRYWLANLSWKQFNIIEFESGFAFKKTEEYFDHV